MKLREVQARLDAAKDALADAILGEMEARQRAAHFAELLMQPVADPAIQTARERIHTAFVRVASEYIVEVAEARSQVNAWQQQLDAMNAAGLTDTPDAQP